MQCDYLKEILQYDPETGLWIWLETRGRMAKKGMRAGYTQKDNYGRIQIDGKHYKTSRLAWLYMTGEMPDPKLQIDHIDRNKDNDRWSNLRLVTPRQNCLNKGIYKNNKSGVTGVVYNKFHKKYQAFLKENGKSKHLGYFDTLEEVKAVREDIVGKLYYGNTV